MEIEMFSRNEKYGQALHLQYGASNGEANDSSMNGHFNASSLWQRVLGSGSHQETENTVEVHLLSDVSRRAANCEYKAPGKSVNENEIEQLGVNNAFVK